MLRLLVYAGARLDIVDDQRGRTPLHFAAANELWCRIRVLLALRLIIELCIFSNIGSQKLLTFGRGTFFSNFNV